METGTLLQEMLEKMIMRGTSDLHLVEGQSPAFREEGGLTRGETPPLTAENMKAVIATLLSEDQQAQTERGEDVDLSLRHAGRLFQLHVFSAGDKPALSARLVLSRVPALQELRYAPEVTHTLADLIRKPRGLILVTGETGSGKQTLCAALLEDINQAVGKRIWTLEDPISYEMQSRQALITQRSVGRDIVSYEAGLRAAMKADVDIVYIGELLSLEAVQLALTLAETGHLVLAVLGVGSVSEAVQRLVDVFGTQGEPIRRLLAQTLIGIVAQRLLPRAGGGRAPLVEILLNAPRTRQAIREGQTDLTLAIEAGQQEGMQTMDDALLAALQAGQISEETAWEQVQDRDRLRNRP